MAAEDDSDEVWTRGELVRTLKRIEEGVRGCVTEKFYIEAQGNTGRRIEGIESRLSKMEEKQESESKARDGQYRKTVGIFVAAGLSFAAGLALMILQLVAK